MPTVAKIALVSSLPQLDRLFDYDIPIELQDSVKIGSRVQVPFGKSIKPLEGFVLDLVENSTFEGSLAKVLSVVGVSPALSAQLLELVQKLSVRSASGIGEILKLAVPANMPRSILAHGAEPITSFSPLPNCSSSVIESSRTGTLTAPNSRHAVLTKPGDIDITVEKQSYQFPSWVVEFCLIAIRNLLEEKSTLLLVPDYRDQEILLAAIDALDLMEFTANYSQEQAKSKVFRAYLRALEAMPRIVVGSRAAMFAPAHNLATIAVFDESDPSYSDQSSPYLNARDVLLLRQSIEECSIVFSSYSRSTDIQRLVETGYLTESNQSFSRPKISVTEQGMRVDSNAFRACDVRALCSICSGPIGIDRNGLSKCMWCNGLSQDIRCSCGSSSFRSGRAGATRTSAELGRAFPGAKVVESTGENRVVTIPAAKTLVIATAGAEPYVPGGYSAVVVLDAAVLLSKQSLRATEDAIRLWANAVSRLSATGEAVLVGVSGDMAQRFALWQLPIIASSELATRRELNLPPALRLGSVSGSLDKLTELATSLGSLSDVQVIGPTPFGKGSLAEEWRLIFKYPYASVVDVAKFLSSEVARVGAGKSLVSKAGRNTRLLKVRMNDMEVI